jgi:hypothetical protein
MEGAMTLGLAAHRPISGLQLLLALVAITLATVVAPPATAWWLNQSRTEQTQERVAAAASRLRTLMENDALLRSSAAVLCGPGRLPDAVPAAAASRPALLETHASWLSAAVSAPDVFGDGMSTDAWGRCFLINAGAAARGLRVWIVSAGPNGLVETALGAPALGGDDIGVVLQ